jgi:hypothetical protein
MAKFYMLQVAHMVQMVGNQRHVINGHNPNYKSDFKLLPSI